MGTKKSSRPQKKAATRTSAKIDFAISHAESRIKYWPKELERLRAKKKILGKKARGNKITEKEGLALLAEESERENRAELKALCTELERFPFSWGEQKRDANGYFFEFDRDQAGIWGVVLWNYRGAALFGVSRYHPPSYGFSVGTRYPSSGRISSLLEKLRHLDDTTSFSQVWATIQACTG